ncbi:pilus assembly protein PilP [Salinicola rhizosphaerae]|uniref:pilus assembly protein PilP n=1 Tax=Salinicola rhizosphaerae TaxID=1443141 RepID=UPI0016724C61|nr:pilus assembly protein PilP [Salinicola rhizosphaerae]
MSRRWRWLTCALVIGLSGCGEADLDALQEHLDALRGKPQGKIAALPDMPAYTVAVYDQAARRSPFEPAQAKSVAPVDTTPLPDADRPRQPLEAFELDSLSLVGTLSVGSQRSGLIEAPDGKVHRVFVGDYLGRDYGQIKTIEPRALALTETIRTEQGGWVERQQRLAMATPSSAQTP